MSELGLDQIEALCAAATDGPWVWGDLSQLSPGYLLSLHTISDDGQGGDLVVTHMAKWCVKKNDQELISQSRTLIPALVARVRDAESLAGDYSKQIHDRDGELAILILARDSALARVRELEEKRSKEAMWAIQRVLELEEEVAGLRADLAEAVSRLDEMGAR